MNKTTCVLFFGLAATACTSPNRSVVSPEDSGTGGLAASADATADGTPDGLSTAPDTGTGGSSQDAALDAGHVGKPDAAEPPPADAAQAPDPDAGPDANVPGPRMYFHIRTNTVPFNHTDGLQGQTARDAYQGIRSFALLQNQNDPHPAFILDLGDGMVEAGYNDGDETLVGSVPLSAIQPGHYTVGRNVVTHSRYKVDATMHAAGLTLPGEFDNIQVLSDGTTVDGVVRPQGWFRYVFRTAGREFPLEGLGAPLPTDPTAGGFALHLEDGQAAYYYPLDVTLAAVPDADVHVMLDVNMDHSFRWEDQDTPGFAPGVFDATPAGSEPVRHFGANSLQIDLQ